MASTIKLLEGDRAATRDVRMLAMDHFALHMRDDEVETVVVNCARWLDAATLSTATDDSANVSIVTSTPNATLTITGTGADEDVLLTLTASDGRVRIIEISIEAIPRPDLIDDDYGFA